MMQKQIVIEQFFFLTEKTFFSCSLTQCAAVITSIDRLHRFVKECRYRTKLFKPWCT